MQITAAEKQASRLSTAERSIIGARHYVNLTYAIVCQSSHCNEILHHDWIRGKNFLISNFQWSDKSMWKIVSRENATANSIGKLIPAIILLPTWYSKHMHVTMKKCSHEMFLALKSTILSPPPRVLLPLCTTYFTSIDRCHWTFPEALYVMTKTTDALKPAHKFSSSEVTKTHQLKENFKLCLLPNDGRPTRLISPHMWQWDTYTLPKAPNTPQLAKHKQNVTLPVL